MATAAGVPKLESQTAPGLRLPRRSPTVPCQRPQPQPAARSAQRRGVRQLKHHTGICDKSLSAENLEQRGRELLGLIAKCGCGTRPSSLPGMAGRRLRLAVQFLRPPPSRVGVSTLLLKSLRSAVQPPGSKGCHQVVLGEGVNPGRAESRLVPVRVGELEMELRARNGPNVRDDDDDASGPMLASSDPDANSRHWKRRKRNCGERRRNQQTLSSQGLQATTPPTRWRAGWLDRVASSLWFRVPGQEPLGVTSALRCGSSSPAARSSSDPVRIRALPPEPGESGCCH